MESVQLLNKHCAWIEPDYITGGDKVDALMLEGWSPILILGIAFAIVLFLISRKVTKKNLFLISNILSLICIVVVIYSILIIDGWEGIGVGVVTVCIFIGIWLGTILGTFSKKQMT